MFVVLRTPSWSSTWIALGLELIFCSIFIFVVKFLSTGQKDYQFAFFIGTAISLALIFTGEIVRALQRQKNKMVVCKVERAKISSSTLIWLFVSAVSLFLVEVFNVWSFALQAPIAERDLLSRLVILIVLFFGARIVFAERSSVLQVLAVTLSLLPALLVLRETDEGLSSVSEQPLWVVLTLLMAVCLGIKRIAGRKCKEGLSHADAMRFSGYLCLPMFLGIAVFIQDWHIPDPQEWLGFLFIFIITPVITFLRQCVYDRKVTPIVHDTLMYLGGLVVVFTFGNLLFPEDAKLSLVGILFCLFFSILAAGLLVLDERKKLHL